MTFMNLVPPPVIPRYAGLSLAEGVTSVTTSTKTTLLISNPIVFTRKGEFVDSETLSPNHTYRLVFGRVNVHKKFDVLLKVHPDLHDKALVSCPSVLTGGYEGPLSLIIRPVETIDLKELTYVLGLSIYE